MASPSLNSHFPIHWGAWAAWCPVPHTEPDTTSSLNTLQMGTPAGNFYPLVPTPNHKVDLSWGFHGISGVQAHGRGPRKMWFAGYSILSNAHSGNSSLGVQFPFSCWHWSGGVLCFNRAAVEHHWPLLGDLSLVSLHQLVFGKVDNEQRALALAICLFSFLFFQARNPSDLLTQNK